MSAVNSNKIIINRVQRKKCVEWAARSAQLTAKHKGRFYSWLRCGGSEEAGAGRLLTAGAEATAGEGASTAPGGGRAGQG